jgi:hypothetical protein
MKIIRSIIILLLIYFSLPCFSQKCGIIADKATKLGISYSSISFIQKPLGTLSDNKGSYCLEISISKEKNDSIFVSALGYENKRLSYKQYIQSDTIFLVEKNILLQEVVVKSKKEKTVILGTFNKHWKLHDASFNVNSNTMVVSKIENINDLDGLITKIHYRINPHRSDLVKKFRVQCRLFKNDSLKNIPSEDILNDNVIIDINPEDKFIEAEISSYNINFKGKSLWVGIQTIGYINKEDIYISLFDHKFGKSVWRKNIFKKGKNMLLSPAYLMTNKGVGKSKEPWNYYWNPVTEISEYNNPVFGITLSY